jgi:hypothetical protein
MSRMLEAGGVSVKASNTAWTWIGLLGLLLGACDLEPVVQLSLSPPVRDAGMPSMQGAAGSSIPEWEKFECDEIDYVCGSDNQTYTNFCQATRAGVTVQKRGAC